jgi:hypothetical protein
MSLRRKRTLLLLTTLLLLIYPTFPAEAAGSEWWEFCKFTEAPTLTFFDNNNSIRVDYTLIQDYMEYYFHRLVISVTVSGFNPDYPSVVLYWMSWGGEVDADNNPWDSEFPSIPLNGSFTIGTWFNMTGSWSPTTLSNELVHLNVMNLTASGGEVSIGYWNETTGAFGIPFIASDDTISATFYASINRFGESEETFWRQASGSLSISGLADTTIIEFEDNSTVFVPVIDYEYITDWITTGLIAIGGAVLVSSLGIIVQKFASITKEPIDKYFTNPAKQKAIDATVKMLFPEKHPFSSSRKTR